MRNFVFAVLSAVMFIESSYAKSIDLYVYNRSEKNIVLEKMDGYRITVHPKSYITTFFATSSEVKNYVDGKYVCSWYTNSSHNMELVGLAYDNPYGKWICVTLFKQRPDLR